LRKGGGGVAPLRQSPFRVRWASVAGSQVGLVGDVDRGMIEVMVWGRWDRRLRSQLSAGLRKCFAEHPRAVLIDLGQLADPTGGLIATVLAARDAAAGLDPPVSLVCCAASGGLARHVDAAGLARSVALYSTVAQARAALDERLAPALRWRAEFSPTYTTVALARDMVSEACSRWQLTGAVHPARLLVSELATNAVDHAAGTFVVTLSRRGPSLLHVAVQDDSEALPYVRELGPVRGEGPLDERGRGLALVAARATAWGAMPCAIGKVVWATIRTPALGRR
jgi:hypothetical protein